MKQGKEMLLSESLASFITDNERVS